MIALVRDYDWSRIIFDLKRAGLGQTQMCAALGNRITESMIRQYMAATSTPSHWRGEMLLRLWEDRTGRSREDAPMRPAPIRHAATRGPRRQKNLSLEALAEVSRAFRIPSGSLLEMLQRARRAPNHGKQHGGNLSLPGFENHD